MARQLRRHITAAKLKGGSAHIPVGICKDKTFGEVDAKACPSQTVRQIQNHGSQTGLIRCDEEEVIFVGSNGVQDIQKRENCGKAAELPASLWQGRARGGQRPN